MRLAADVLEGDVEFIRLAILRLDGLALLRPTQRTLMHKDVHHHWRCQQIALQVSYVAQCDIDVRLFDTRLRFIDVDEQVLLVGHVAVVQVRQHTAVVHRRIDVSVGHEVNDFRTYNGVRCRGVHTLAVAHPDDAQSRGHEALCVVALTLQTAEGHIDHRSQLLTSRSCFGVVLDEVLRQRHLKHC